MSRDTVPAPLRVPPVLPDRMLHGSLVHARRLGWDGSHVTGAALRDVDLDAARTLPGVVCVLPWPACVGVVAVSALHLRQAVSRLDARWEHPAAHAENAPDDATFRWTSPAPTHPDERGVVVWCSEHAATVWGDLHDPAACVAELGLLTGLLPERIQLTASSGAAMSAQNQLAEVDAVAAAALLSRAVGAPVRVMVSTPSGGHPLAMRIGAASRALVVPGPWSRRPSLARLLSRADGARPNTAPETDTPYAGLALQVDDRPGELQSEARSIDHLAAQTFALESHVDDCAAAAQVDPVDYRLQNLVAPRARALVSAVAESAGWHAESGLSLVETNQRRGRGVALAETRDTADGTAWSAWIVDVSVDTRTGEIDVARVVVGHDARALSPATPARIETDRGPLLEVARTLLAPPAGGAFDQWGSSAAPAPVPDTIREGHPVVDGVSTLPAAAAIANAVFDATGVRLRDAPFDAGTLRRAMQEQALPAAAQRGTVRSAKAWLAGAATAALGALAMAWPAKPALPWVEAPDLSLYSAEALERGRLVAAAGDCVVCHTAPGGAPNAGGLGLATPFGTIYTTNITPDPTTGIGRWSFAAFDRAMRQGVHRDGRQLYPAFPYTAFARLSEGDMQSLYGHLMSQPPVTSEVPPTVLPFPYGLRPLMAGWNLLFHRDGSHVPDPARSAEWNRGAYLVQGAGHCGACHTPRNLLGAEKDGREHQLAGADVEGWHAPALNRLRSGEHPWTADELFEYLRHGYSARHGVAAGPMAPVIHGLAQLPERDVRAIVTYLGSLDAAPESSEAASVTTVTAPVAAPVTPPLAQLPVSGERIYQRACAACHESGQGPTLFGAKPDLAASTSLRLKHPDNVLQVVLHGISEPAEGDLGYMPGFKDHLDDTQVADLVDYLRARFAPGQARWNSVSQRSAHLREHPAHGR